MARKKRKNVELEYQDAELNIMPFIDVFSVLNTFLLFSAVFVAFGVIKVQVPFLTNKQVEDKPKRTLQVKVDVEKDKATLITSYTMPPVNEQKSTYNLDEAGMTAMHQKLVQIRSENQETDLVTCYTEDDVTYEKTVLVLDAIKLRREGDPVFNNEDPDESDLANSNYLFPKIVMGSVIL